MMSDSVTRSERNMKGGFAIMISAKSPVVPRNILSARPRTDEYIRRDVFSAATGSPFLIVSSPVGIRITQTVSAHRTAIRMNFPILRAPFLLRTPRPSVIDILSSR